MPWLLVLHISGLVGWCALLLYLAVLIPGPRAPVPERAAADGVDLSVVPLPRMVFVLLATPAALLTIVSGTALFLLGPVLAVWLALKLTAVTGMVLCHVLLGLLILRRERAPQEPLVLHCGLLGGVALALIGLVLWLVLVKPG